MDNKFTAEDISHGLRFRFAMTGKTATVDCSRPYLQDGEHDIITSDGTRALALNNAGTARRLNDGIYELVGFGVKS